MRSETMFANSRFAGLRMPATSTVSPEQIRTMMHYKPIRVHDARALESAPSITTMGFELVQAEFKIDFSDRETVTTRFYDFCEELVKAVTNCSSARTVQHEFRTDITTPRGEPGAYAQAAHADMTPFIEDAISIPLNRHFGIYNIWLNIDEDNPIESYPLALCDARTVANGDMVCADGWRLTKPQTKLVFYYLVHRNSQTWFYFPLMSADEVIVFRQYDSRIGECSNRVTFHTAFKDATTRIDAPLRKTIEARVVAEFKEEDRTRMTRRTSYQAEVAMCLPDGQTSTWRFEPMLDWDNTKWTGGL